METNMIMDEKMKRNFGILAFIPVVAWGITLLYYLYTLMPLIQARRVHDGIAMATITAHNYTTMFYLIATSAIISAIVLITFFVHLTKLRNINSGTKLMWALILAALVPFSFVMFWFLHIRNEERETPVYDSIA
ncbi:MAG: hypothetical protein H0X33_14685 [Taibaiella sp.]|nr:hypothetical protein [Taibaiella sp.]